MRPKGILPKTKKNTKMETMGKQIPKGQGAVAMLGMRAADTHLRDSDTDSEKDTDTDTDTWLPLTTFHKMSRLEAVSTIFHFSAPPCSVRSLF